MNKRSAKLKALENQVQRLNTRISRLKRLSTRYSWYRMTIFLVGVGLSASMYWVHGLLIWVAIFITIAIFSIVAYYHRRVDSSILKHEIWLELKEIQVARMKLDWENIPPSPVLQSPIEHPFEIDLDITGDRSLHQLIDSSISHNGSQRLADWLLQEIPDLKLIHRRQKIIRELIPLSLFRDKLLLCFKLVSKARLEAKKILNWLAQISPLKSLKWILALSSSLCILNWMLFYFYVIGAIRAYWLLSLMIYGIVYFMNRRIWASLFDDTIFLEDEFKKSMTIFRYLETYPYRHNKNLAQLCAPFLEKQHRPSVQLRRLMYLTVAVGLRMNFLVGMILNATLPWDIYCAYFLNKRKLTLAERFPVWLDVCFELEAFISLADFTYLNPDYVFPEISDDKNEIENVFFQAKGLGHPLIPAEQKICNDFSFHDLGEIVLITGSNMAGKSTFLKTLGINLCLAYAGAPINAQMLKTALFQIFTCIKVNDSIADGISQFYAEVKRLKRLLSLIETDSTLPLFFLIDEIYKGTNNRERLIGSRSFIRTLIGQKGLGAVSTHDLELANLGENFPKFKNTHFREEVVDGKMVFDYKLRPGPCPTTNALKIMRMEGLPVEGSG